MESGGEAVALLVLQVEHLGFAGAAFASRAVGALRVGWDEEFYDDWRCAVYVCFFPADDVAFVREDTDFGDAKFYMVGIVQVGIAQVGVAQVGTMQAVESMLFEDGFDVFAFEDAVWCGDFHCGSLTCWRCAPRPNGWMGLSGWYRTRTRKRVPCRRSEQYPYYGYW